MALSNAERQAAYRARHRNVTEVAPEPPDPLIARLRARILELEEENGRLVTERSRQRALEPPPSRSFNSRPFSPAPKR